MEKWCSCHQSRVNVYDFIFTYKIVAATVIFWQIVIIFIVSDSIQRSGIVCGICDYLCTCQNMVGKSQINFSERVGCCTHWFVKDCDLFVHCLVAGCASSVDFM